jgi:DNA-binding response OmpR family regulator
VVTGTINNGADYYLQKGGDPDSLFAEIVHKLRKEIQSRQDEDIIRTNKQRLKGARYRAYRCMEI